MIIISTIFFNKKTTYLKIDFNLENHKTNSIYNSSSESCYDKYNMMLVYVGKEE